MAADAVHRLLGRRKDANLNLHDEPSSVTGRGVVLVVDDEATMRSGLGGFLAAEGYATREAESCEALERLFSNAPPDAVLLDYHLADGESLSLLPRLREAWPHTAVFVVTGRNTVELAVQALQQGADQLLTKPIDLSALRCGLDRAIESQRLRRRQKAGTMRRRPEVDIFVGTSPAIRALEEEAGRTLASSSPVLLTGETGAGKGMLARWLHRHGTRSAQPFVGINCAGLSRELLETELFGHEPGAFTGATHVKEGLFEVANHGTVFLDELGDMDLVVQTKLLKVLEERRFRRLGGVKERTVDIRIIAATHQSLAALVKAMRFRSDLFYRLGVLALHVPPLRERVQDIEALSGRLLEELSSEMGRSGVRLTAAAVRSLEVRAWPGNVRELRNVLERAILRTPGTSIDVADLPADSAPELSPEESASSWDRMTLQELERMHIQRVLRQEDGRVDRAAIRLGISRSTLYQRLRDYRVRLSGRRC